MQTIDNHPCERSLQLAAYSVLHRLGQEEGVKERLLEAAVCQKIVAALNHFPGDKQVLGEGWHILAALSLEGDELPKSVSATS